MKYKNLGNTGVLVSELCFGTMTFGGSGMWENIGKLKQDEANNLLKIAYDSGINFFDTANVYSFGQSEEMLGKGIRDLSISREKVVIATKVRGRMDEGANEVGLSRLHIMDSVDASLKRLGTDHIDLLYIHGVDPITPLEETMRGLEDVVRMGKVRYIGISNHPGWKIIKANAIAEKNGWTKFVAGQHYYSIAGRDLEREVIPALQDQQMALMPWSPLAGGFLSGKYTRENEKGGGRRDNFDFPPINKEHAYDIIEEMQKIAQNHDVSVARVALAWVLQQKAVSSVIIGAKKEDQLRDNIASVDLKFSEDEMKKLEEISALSKEYPGWMVERQSQGRFPKKD